MKLEELEISKKILLLDQKGEVWVSQFCGSSKSAYGNKKMQFGKLFLAVFQPVCKALIKREKTLM